ncbi:MAG: hypothetical protein ACM3Y9_09200 [Ignavibacteria bacterium]
MSLHHAVAPAGHSRPGGPVRGGIEALNWLCEQYGRLPCLLITGDIEAERLKAVRQSGFLCSTSRFPRRR